MARGSARGEDDADGAGRPGDTREQAAQQMRKRRLELGRVDVSRQLASAPEKGPYRDMLQKALRAIDQQLSQLG